MPNTTIEHDCHHLLWPKAHWTIGNARRLREHWYLSVSIPKDTLHAKIHDEIPGIPLASGIACKSALEQLAILERYGVLRSGDSAAKRIEILIALFDCASPHTVSALREQLKIVSAFQSPH